MKTDNIFVTRHEKAVVARIPFIIDMGSLPKVDDVLAQGEKLARDESFQKVKEGLAPRQHGSRTVHHIR